MPQSRQFNYLNLFYGIGATIILIAAMFKFLGWPYANNIFVAGIVVEAFVFFISAFDWSNDNKDYEWEKVFPQLDDNGPSGQIATENALAEGTQQQQLQQIMSTVSVLNKSVNDLNTATLKLTKSVSTMENNYEIVNDSTKKYQEEIDSLRLKIKSANDKLKDFEKFNYNS